MSPDMFALYPYGALYTVDGDEWAVVGYGCNRIGNRCVMLERNHIQMYRAITLLGERAA